MDSLPEKDNVILFPTLRRNLEQMEKESYELIEDNDYEQALEKLKILLSHQYTSFDINMNTLHCLTKLGRWKEAEQFNEMLLKNEDDEYYYDYLGYYIMILYEQNNYSALMTTILEEEKKRHIPPPFNKKFKDIYRLCYQMNMMKANELLHQFKTAIEEENHREQLFYIHQWVQLHVEPSEMIVHALRNNKVHPVVKTKILEVLKERNLTEKLTVEKFGREIEICPAQLVDIKEQELFQTILDKLSEVEQNDPTLYALIEQLVYQYHYVRYPFLFDVIEIDQLTEAFVFVGKKHLAMTSGVDEKIKNEVETIEICSQMYLNVMDH